MAASRVYKSKRNIILGAGILFVAAGERQREGATHLRAHVRLCVRARGRACKATLPGRSLGPGAFRPLSQAPSPPAGRGRCVSRRLLGE